MQKNKRSFPILNSFFIHFILCRWEIDNNLEINKEMKLKMALKIHCSKLNWSVKSSIAKSIILQGFFLSISISDFSRKNKFIKTYLMKSGIAHEVSRDSFSQNFQWYESSWGLALLWYHLSFILCFHALMRHANN